ncbi:ABC transporter permease [Brachybacterium sp. YJGR34]|uniref:PhnE/PtxC family ABC transporter permease n=1 Tax=Brachybacterium sp. YJGR34 TaxID=2059911 RepID=UPI000E0C97C9|nr:ABC transporter permease subunit [Brachybacterium sp. YJGR34]
MSAAPVLAPPTGPRPGAAPPRTLTRPRPGGTAAAAVMLTLVALGAWSVIDLGIDLPTVLGSVGNAVAFVQRMLPLDFPPAAELAAMIGQTLAIVLLSTLLAIGLSVPLSLAAARATTRGRLSRGTARTLIVLARAIPDLVLAIVFLRLFGLGPVAGILAMGLHSVGMIGKLYADAIEELDDAPRRAVEALGGTRRQQIWTAIPLALLPQIIATGLHRFDINLRTSVLLGYVGVGGIGLAIADALRALDYQRGMALAVVVLALCIVVELTSGAIRAAILPRTDRRAAETGWADRLLARSTGTPSGPAAPSITPPWTVDRLRRLLSGAMIVLLALASVRAVEIDAGTLLGGILEIPSTLLLFLPPGFGGSASLVFADLLVTVQIALAATLLGALLAVPIGILAARTVVAHRAVHTSARLLIVIIRGIPELILAILFVVITGLGAVAGTLALALGAVGLLSKLIADSLEETDVRVQEAVRTVGASGPQVFLAATLRQAAPAVVAHVMYLLDTNIRAATLLGVVGAGGVGFLLLNAARINQFEVVTAIVLLMLLVVLAVEALALWLRRAVR